MELGAGAAVAHYLVQDQAERPFNFSSLRAHQGASSFASCVVALGGAVARHQIGVHLDGEGATADLDGVYLPRSDQHHDHSVFLEHRSPRCTSRQRYVGIADDRGHGVFNGHVVVCHGAAGTDASQSNNPVPLRPGRGRHPPPPRGLRRRGGLRPQVGHGGLDADAVFYLRSQGFPEANARGLPVQGVASPVVDRIGIGPLRHHRT